MRDAQKGEGPYGSSATTPLPSHSHQERTGGNYRAFAWHLMIPYRDEEAVIAHTLRYVRTTFPYAHVWVIDDGSTDDTGKLVARDAGVRLISRGLPDARTGKADALNAGYRRLRDWLVAQDALDEADRTIVCALDGDGAVTSSSRPSTVDSPGSAQGASRAATASTASTAATPGSAMTGSSRSVSRVSRSGWLPVRRSGPVRSGPGPHPNAARAWPTSSGCWPPRHGSSSPAAVIRPPAGAGLIASGRVPVTRRTRGLLAVRKYR